MEQVKVHVPIPQYARINFFGLKWSITVTLCVSQDVKNVLVSNMKDIPADMFFHGRSKTWKYQKSVSFEYDPKIGITNAADEADKLLRDMQKDICFAKKELLDRKLKRLDYPSWMSDEDIEYYYGEYYYGDEEYE